MIAMDIRNREEIRTLMQKAIKDGDTEGFYQALDQMLAAIQADLQQSYESQVNGLRQDLDSRILSARGVRQLTTQERDYYQKVIAAMQSQDPKQALANVDVVMPETVIESVFEDLRANHPLLSAINFIPATGRVRMLVNTNGRQEAQWGDLCDEIVKELLAGFKEVDSGLMKLTAFLPVCKASLDLGPEWLDRFVRETLYEALAAGLEVGIVVGTGKNMPIGMNRQVGDGVTVKGGIYPEKAKIAVTELSIDAVGNLLSLLAVDPNGKSRTVRDVLFIVNPQDYYQKVMPATTVMAPDGTYRNDVMPYPMRVIPSGALDRGCAILGLGYRYFAAAGTDKAGRIEYSDHYQFLEDNRVYLIKAYANGQAKDDNAFLYLDISGLRPAVWKMEQVTAPAPSTNAELSGLKMGALTLSPEFVGATTSYTASTTNATNVITAIPADAGAEVEILVDPPVADAYEIDNGTAVTWESGETTVTINVTAADGSTTKAYTVTVTKS